MMLENQSHALESLASGLKLKFSELGLLIDVMRQQATPYDFFRTLATHLIPLIRRSKGCKTLITKWDKETCAARKTLNHLQQEAVREVTSAYDMLSKRLEDSTYLRSVDGLEIILKQTGQYLDGTQPVYMPSHFEMAADTLASACRLLVANGAIDLVSELVEPVDFPDRRTPPSIAKCYFYNAISKINKENAKWGWDSFDIPHVCWSYFRLTEHCWHLQTKDFEKESLQHHSIEASAHSGELLELHSFWVELQGIRNRRNREGPFFTIERFSKYLEVICLEILALESDEKEQVSIGIHALSLHMDGEHLLLLLEEDGGQKKIPHLLHKFNGPTSPYHFLRRLIDSPDKDCTPSDLNMCSNSSSNLLDRANIKGTLRKIFFKRGSRKGSIQLISPRVVLKDIGLSSRLDVKTQLEEMKLGIYQTDTHYERGEKPMESIETKGNRDV